MGIQSHVSSSPSVTLTYTALPPAGISGRNVAWQKIQVAMVRRRSWICATLSTPAISGPSIGCPGNTETYIVGPVDGAASYTRTITGNATLNGGGATITTLDRATMPILQSTSLYQRTAWHTVMTNRGQMYNISNAPNITVCNKWFTYYLVRDQRCLFPFCC